MKILINLIVFFVLSPLSLQALSLRVLCYHNIVENPKFNIDVSASDFEAQMALLQKEGFISLTASELAELLKKPGIEKDKNRYVAITFDDGNDGVYAHAVPILKKYGLKATFYIYPTIIAARERGTRKAFMTWAQIKEVVNTPGFELGCHSYYHPFLTKETDAGLILNTRKARQVLKEKTGKDPLTFAYPFGLYDDRVVERVKQEGFLAAFSVDVGHTTAKTDVYRIPRIMFYSYFSLEFFERMVKGESLHSGNPTAGNDKKPRKSIHGYGKTTG